MESPEYVALIQKYSFCASSETFQVNALVSPKPFPFAIDNHVILSNEYS